MSNAHGEDPFRPRGGTVLRPRPGAGKRGISEVGYRAHALEPSVDPEPRPMSSGVRETLGIGLNPLVQAASPLLLLAGKVRGMLQGDVPSLRRQAHEEIRRFEERARGAGIANEIVLAARYALCAALDEAVLATPWGQQSDWSQQTLLITLHREAWGGEKFFDMLERMSSDSQRHLDLLELQYLCLSMGFAGKYQVVERGHIRLDEIHRDLYSRIRQSRDDAVTDELSLRWRGVEDRRNPVVRYVPWWVIAAAALAILTFAFIFFYVRLGQISAPVQAELAKVGLSDFTTPVAAVPASGPRLKQLLEPDEAQGLVTVEEQGGRTLVTLTAPQLFASGSAIVNPSQYTTLQHIAAALDQVPGRVLVVGHTDDQPLTSLKYRDNFELSRERALSVVNLLKRAIAQAGRLEYTGVGATEPRYTPASTPDNRARNRRVEIVHVAAAR